MTPKFPASPIPGHAFVPFPEKGMLYDVVGEDEWIVILQRDHAVRGPRPALCYVPVQRGLPSDIIGYHLMNAEQAEAIADRQMTDVLRLAPSVRNRMMLGCILAASLLATLAAAKMRKA